jgi:hypothetical protein
MDELQAKCEAGLEELGVSTATGEPSDDSTASGGEDLYERIDRKGLQLLFENEKEQQTKDNEPDCSSSAVDTNTDSSDGDLSICASIAASGGLGGITKQDTWEASSIDQLFQGSQEANSLDQLFTSSLFAPVSVEEVAPPDPEPEADSSESEQEAKDEKLRQRIAQEILSTESVYVNCLQVLDQQFITPLLLAHKARETSTSDETITKKLSANEVQLFPK